MPNLKRIILSLLLSLVVTESSFAADAPLKMSKHAKERQEQRGVTDDQIRRALKEPGQPQAGKNTLKHKGSKTTVISGKGGKVVTTWHH